MKNYRKLMMAVVMACAGTVAMAATPAMADDWHHDHDDHRGGHHDDWHHDDWRRHERDAWRWHHSPHVVVTDSYYYNPYYNPPVVYAPPPVIYREPPPPPLFSFIFPLDIR